MNYNNPLEEIWQSYIATRDSFMIAARAIRYEKYIGGTSFMGVSKDKAKDKIGLERKGIDDFFILSLWASFEQFVLAHVRNSVELINDIELELAENISKKLDREVDRWKLSDVLDLFKDNIDPNVIGQAKKIKNYRDWVAHRNINRPPPDKAIPKTAYDVLSVIIDEISKIVKK